MKSVRKHSPGLLGRACLVLALIGGMTFGGSRGFAQMTPMPSMGVSVRTGFRVAIHAGPGLADDVHCLTVDALGRVVVASDGYIKTLIDLDLDGVADRALEFAEFRRPVTGLGFVGGTLMVAGADGLYLLRDEDLDGVADGPAAQVLTLPVDVGGYGVHGVRSGPDGWWYAVGGRGMGLGKDLISTRHSPVAAPESGALFRVSPDGTLVECLAHGLANPYDFDFHGNGDVFTADADEAHDLGLPWYLPARLCLVLPGGDFGVRNGRSGRSWPQLPFYPDIERSVMDLDRAAPSGLVIYRHYQFPEYFRNGIFEGDWLNGRIMFHRLQAAGAGYEAEASVFVAPLGREGFTPTDVEVAPDGCLLIATGGRKTRGGVYRVQYIGDAEYVRQATNWVQNSITSFDAAMIAPQPLAAWSRDYWEPVLLDVGPEALEVVARDGKYVASLRVRAIERLTELYGGLGMGVTEAAARANSPEVRARVAWSIGREPCDDCLPVLLDLAGDTEAYVRQYALGALLEQSEDVNMVGIRQAVVANLVHPDKTIRRMAAQLAAAMTEPAWQALWNDLQASSVQARLTGLLAKAWRRADAGLVPEIVTEALELFEQAGNPGQRLQALRLIFMGLSDMNLENPSVDLYTTYESARDLTGQNSLTQDMEQTLNPVFPTGGTLVDYEMARLLGVIQTADPAIPGRLLSQIDAASSGWSDFHYLTVVSRLPSKNLTNHTVRVAHALLSMAGKEEPDLKDLEHGWVGRLESLTRLLLTKDSGLAEAMLVHPSLADPAHARLVPLLGPENYLRAVRRFLSAIQDDANYPWTPPLVEMLSTMPIEVVRPHFRKHWVQGELRAGLVMKLAERAEALDRDKFLWATESTENEVIRAGVGGLMKLPMDPSRNTLLAAMRLLRRQTRVTGEEAAGLRKTTLGLVSHESGLSLRIRELDASVEGVTKAYAPVFKWFARTFPAWHGRLDEMDRVNGAVWELKLKVVRWDEGNPDVGRVIYAERGCRRCHEGPFRLGPDLAGIGSEKSREEIMTSLLFPSREVTEKDRETVIRTRDGREYRGRVVHESPEYLIVQSGMETTLRLAQTDVAARYQSRESLMPDKLLQGLTSQGLADLYQFIRSK